MRNYRVESSQYGLIYEGPGRTGAYQAFDRTVDTCRGCVGHSVSLLINGECREQYFSWEAA